MSRINYVIACWGGRGVGGESAKYIQTHIDLLNKLENNIAQVTIVSPPYSDKPIQGFEKTLVRLDGTTLDNGAPIVVVYRAVNANMSYGSFSDAYGTYRQQFDYYIFMEDDYLPARPNFDSILVDILEEKQCHYLCMFVSPTTCRDTKIPHAGVTVGVCKSTAMEIIWQKYGSLLSDDFDDWHWYNQMNFSYPYHYCGLKIADCSDQYVVSLWYKTSVKELHPGNQHLLVPIQMQNVIVYDG